jgi:flagellar biosynthesis GTPase FlhF
MDMSQKELVKSLTSLIDETLEEIEVIKKSKFAASEISIQGPGDTKMGGKPTNGSIGTEKKEDEDEDEDSDHEKKESKKEEKKEHGMDKGENEKADPDAGKFAQAPSVSKGENEKADPDAGKFAQAPTVSKKDEDKDEDGDEDEDKKKKEMKDLKKSISRSEDLMKSYVDEKFSTLEERLSKLTKAIESIANAPVGRRGVPAGVQALAKSADEGEALTKSRVVDQLWDLKKSGTRVDSSDIFTAETCKSYGELKAMADKYGVK